MGGWLFKCGLQGAVPGASGSVGLGGGLSFCLSNVLLEDRDRTVRGQHRENRPCERPLSSRELLRIPGEHSTKDDYLCGKMDSFLLMSFNIVFNNQTAAFSFTQLVPGCFVET